MLNSCMEKLNGKKIVVAGATGGIGSSLVKLLVQSGAEVFITGIRKDFVVYYINISFYKSFIFAIIISTVPSFYGYYVKGGALEIGKSGTKSVVVSCILILIADYIIAAIAL
jgi:phospholipid/cholesterol/gamma-HCH transport system permease protein